MYLPIRISRRAATAAVVVTVATLAAGCPGPRTAGPGGAGAALSPSTASQREMSKRCSPEPTKFQQCILLGDDGELLPETTGTTVTVAIDETKIVVGEGDYQRPYTLTPSHLGDGYQAEPDQGYKYAGFRDAVVLIDDLIYFLHEYFVDSGTGFELVYICARDDDQRTIRRLSAADHARQIRAYNERRYAVEKPIREAAAAAATAAAEAPVPLTEEEEAKLAHARTMVSFVVEAYCKGAAYHVGLNATATFADGSTMFIGGNNPIFEHLFAHNAHRAEIGVYVEMWLKDDESIRDDQEVFYDLDEERTFVCRGETGATGLDLDGIGAKNYGGRRGERGPDITVEITTTGRRNDQGEQFLRYRLTCDEQTKVFDVIATTQIHVATYGGKGGHAIPGIHGAGNDGGWGGDGGDTTVIVDPDVESYNLSHVSKGGDGGAASDPAQTNDSEEGTPGRPGADGNVVKREETVAIP
jgi:hypothetical protein